MLPTMRRVWIRLALGFRSDEVDGLACRHGSDDPRECWGCASPRDASWRHVRQVKRRKVRQMRFAPSFYSSALALNDRREGGV